MVPAGERPEDRGGVPVMVEERTHREAAAVQVEQRPEHRSEVSAVIVERPEVDRAAVEADLDLPAGGGVPQRPGLRSRSPCTTAAGGLPRPTTRSISSYLSLSDLRCRRLTIARLHRFLHRNWTKSRPISYFFSFRRWGRYAGNLFLEWVTTIFIFQFFSVPLLTFQGKFGII